MKVANGMALDPDARYAEMAERVTNLSGKVNNLDANITRIGTALEAQITVLSNKVAESQKTPLQAISVIVAIATLVIGAFGYSFLTPTTAAIAEVKAMVVKLADESLSPDERAYRTERNTEDRLRQAKEAADLRAMIDDVRDESVSVKQWAEQTHGRDVQISDMQTRIDATILQLSNRIDNNSATISANHTETIQRWFDIQRSIMDAQMKGEREDD